MCCMFSCIKTISFGGYLKISIFNLDAICFNVGLLETISSAPGRCGSVESTKDEQVTGVQWRLVFSSILL